MNQLHTYQCPLPHCGTTLTTPARARMQHGYQCDACGAYMRYLWAEPIDSDERRALARRGLVYKHSVADVRPPIRRQRCARGPHGLRPGCLNHVDPATAIEIPGIGYVCSDACGEAAVAQHAEHMERIAQHRLTMPWLYEKEPTRG